MAAPVAFDGRMFMSSAPGAGRSAGYAPPPFPNTWGQPSFPSPSPQQQQFPPQQPPSSSPLMSASPQYATVASATTAYAPGSTIGMIGSNNNKYGMAMNSANAVPMQGMGLGNLDPMLQSRGLGVISPNHPVYIPPKPQGMGPAPGYQQPMSYVPPSPAELAPRLMLQAVDVTSGQQIPTVQIPVKIQGPQFANAIDALRNVNQMRENEIVVMKTQLQQLLQQKHMDAEMQRQRDLDAQQQQLESMVQKMEWENFVAYQLSHPNEFRQQQGQQGQFNQNGQMMMGGPNGMMNNGQMDPMMNGNNNGNGNWNGNNGNMQGDMNGGGMGMNGNGNGNNFNGNGNGNGNGNNMNGSMNGNWNNNMNNNNNNNGNMNGNGRMSAPNDFISAQQNSGNNHMNTPADNYRKSIMANRSRGMSRANNNNQNNHSTNNQNNNQNFQNNNNEFGNAIPGFGPRRSIAPPPLPQRDNTAMMMGGQQGQGMNGMNSGMNGNGSMNNGMNGNGMMMGSNMNGMNGGMNGGMNQGMNQNQNGMNQGMGGGQW